MGHGRHVTGSSYPTPTPPAPVADYNVATNPALVPDCSCNYFEAGIHNDYPYYRREDGGFFIWRGPIVQWWIGAILGNPFGNRWNKAGEAIPGNYSPQGGAVGTATVSAGPH